MNAKIRTKRREVGNKLFNEFIRNELSEAEQKIVADWYNKTFNSYVRPDYKQVPLLGSVDAKFKGRELDLKPIQREGAGFLSTKGVGALAYDVGVARQ